MGTTDANGIYFWEDTDSISPFHTALNVAQQSVSDALDASARIFPAADVAARAVVATAHPASTSNPLFVYRADATVNRKLEVTTNGTTWTSVNTGPNYVIRDSAGGSLPATSVPKIQSFVVSATTNGSGAITVTFPEAFTTAPIVTATTAQGASISPVINSNAVTNTTVQLIWPGVASTVVRTHIQAIGW